MSSRKTWSQQLLATTWHVRVTRHASWLSRDRRSLLLLALKTTLAAGLCYWLATLAGLADGYWGSISAIIVMQSNVGSTVKASRDRLIGTLIGAAFGAVFSLLGTGLWTYLLAVVTAMAACSLLGLKNSSRLAGVTVTILMLVHRTGSNWTLPMHRVLEVLLGIVVALGISALVFPSRARTRLREGLSHEYLLLGSLLESVMAGFRGEPVENLQELRKDVEATILANGQLLEAARDEPGGEQASLEGLSLLHQFGRTIQDVLRALELAVEGGREDGYVAYLEPELSGLAEDVHRGFLYVAGCIARWRFHVAPRSLHLETDIAALEAKLAATRPVAMQYPQAEILRAYALQLHLKQLARMLRSARVQTSLTVEGGGK